VKITILVEGKTERVFLPHLRDFIEARGLAGKMPLLHAYTYDGRIPKGEKLRRVVADLLAGAQYVPPSSCATSPFSCVLDTMVQFTSGTPPIPVVPTETLSIPTMEANGWIYYTWVNYNN
jgi:hypothetical protein